MPPNHWVRLRQKRMDLGNCSTLARTEEPVAVNPEVVSKKASTNDRILLLIRKGSIPSTIPASQETVIKKMRSLLLVKVTNLLFEIENKNTPEANAINEGIKKGFNGS